MKVPILTLSSVLGKFVKFLMSYSKPQASFSSNLYDSSVLWKTGSLYFFRSDVIYFARKEPIKVEIFETLSARIKIYQILVIFKTTNRFFLQILHHSLVSWDVNPLYLFIWNFLYFQQKQPIKVQIWWNFIWAVESLKLCTLLGSFCKNHKKFQLKK